MNIGKIKLLYGKTAILDNNIICDFIELEALHLLNQVFGQIEIPENILNDELIIHGYREQLDSNVFYNPVSIQKIESYYLFREIQTKAPALTDYDVEVIVLANERAVLCTSNEGKIRKVCEQYRIDYTGTIGILCCAYEHKIIENHHDFSILIKKLFYETKSWLNPSLQRKIFEHYKISSR